MTLYRRFLILSYVLIPFLLSQPLAAQPTGEEFTPVQASDINQALTLFEQGQAAYERRQMQEAINYWQQALALYDSPEQRAYTLGNLAIAYEEIGQYPEALAAHKIVLDIFTELEKPGLIGQELSNLGNVYTALGDYEKAIEAYQEGLEIAQEVGDSQGEGISIGNLGYIYFLQGKPDEATAMYEQGLTLARSIGDLEGEGSRLLNMGLVYYSRNNIQQAKEFYQQSLAVAREGSFVELEASSLMNLGLATADFDQFDDAIQYFEQSLAITNENNDPILTAKTLNNLGHTLLSANRLAEAEARLRESVRVLDSLRSGELGDTYNVSIFDTQIYTYNLLTQILVASNQVESALEASEAGRTRAFSELLKSRTSANTQSATASKSLSATPSIADIREIARKQNATLVEYSLVPEEEFSQQGKLRGTTAELYIWVVQPDGTVYFRRSPIDTQTHRLEDLVKTSRAAIGVRNREVRNRGFEFPDQEPIDSNQNLKTLHQLLIAPIQDLLPTDPERQVIFHPPRRPVSGALPGPSRQHWRLFNSTPHPAHRPLD
jgi:tetratricopeptide (TPR) repeat protein